MGKMPDLGLTGPLAEDDPSNPPAVDNVLYWRCAQQLAVLIDTHNWTLVRDHERATIAHTIYSRVRQAMPQSGIVPDTLILSCTWYCYSDYWYTACQKQRTLEQQRAYLDLSHHIDKQLWRFTTRLAAVPHDPLWLQDVRQEILISVFRALSGAYQGPRDPGYFLAWLSKVTRRTFFHRLSHYLAQSATTLSPSQPAPVNEPDAVDPQMTTAFRAWFETVLTRAIPRSKTRRRVAWLYFADGRSIGEIAQQLNLTPKQVREYKAHALRVLRLYLAAHDIPQEW